MSAQSYNSSHTRVQMCKAKHIMKSICNWDECVRFESLFLCWPDQCVFFFFISIICSGMLNIHTLKSIRRPIITSSKSMDTKVMPVIHWMIHGMVQTIAHSRHTIVIMIEAHWTAPACLRYVYTLYQFAHFVYFCTRMPINRIKPVYFQCRVDGGGNLADEVWMDCIYTIHKI